MPRPTVDQIARALCREQCAVYGEPPCFEIVPDDWPNRGCDEPGCHALAAAVAAFLSTPHPSRDP